MSKNLSTDVFCDRCWCDPCICEVHPIVRDSINNPREHEQPPEREREWLSYYEWKFIREREIDEPPHDGVINEFVVNRFLKEKYGTPAEHEQRIREDEQDRLAKFHNLPQWAKDSLKITCEQVVEVDSLRKRVRELEATSKHAAEKIRLVLRHDIHLSVPATSELHNVMQILTGEKEEYKYMKGDQQ